VAVPTQERVGLDIDQRVAPSEPWTQGRHYPTCGIVGPPRPDLPLLEQSQLLSQEEVLGHQRRPGTRREGNQPYQTGGNGETLTELDIDCPGSHVTKRYRPARAGSDEIFADHSHNRSGSYATKRYRPALAGWDGISADHR
jgi:hypothetical protein